MPHPFVLYYFHAFAEKNKIEIHSVKGVSTLPPPGGADMYINLLFFAAGVQTGKLWFYFVKTLMIFLRIRFKFGSLKDNGFFLIYFFFFTDL